LVLKRISSLATFMSGEARAGLILMGAAVLALVVANSPLAGAYDALLHHDVTIGTAPFALSKSVAHWINDGLMVVFFFLVGLEIKREIVAGELSTRAKAALPVIAAAGGMAGPAVIYAALNAGDGEAMRGWAIPTATDIAFALGILALLGSRVPPALKVFLTALAVIDDLGAILIIAIFYTADLSVSALGMAGVCIAVLVAFNHLGVRTIAAYVAVGVLFWLAVLESGVHATVAGVITALCIPADQKDDRPSPSARLEGWVHPYVIYLILPLFAFANAGVALGEVTAAALFDPVTLGIVLGLFLGKQGGVLAAAYGARALGWAQLPAGATGGQFYGVALLTGVGFTMSLFVGNLAFTGGERLAEVKIGVLAGSILSGIAGYIILRLAKPINK
jgi:NhaA family Na+:H+ antiporter